MEESGRKGPRNGYLLELYRSSKSHLSPRSVKSGRQRVTLGSYEACDLRLMFLILVSGADAS